MTDNLNSFDPATGLSVRVDRDFDKASAQETWQILEAKVDRPFFLSWAWIGSWLETIEEAPMLITVCRDEEVIGLAFLVEHLHVRHKAFRVRQLVLHGTGHNEMDSITIEYNNFLCAPSDEQSIWAAFLELAPRIETLGYDEILIPGLSAPLFETLQSLSQEVQVRAQAGSAFVDLEAKRGDGVESRDDYVATLGKNTRAQIRRSIRLYEERAPIRLTRAKTHDEAWSFLMEAAPYHAQRWESRGGTGAFNRPAYKAFHQRLIDNSFGDGLVEVIRLSTGDEGFAWIYNFVDRGVVYFYLCAFRFEEDNRLKPGLVAHSLCIADHIERGTRKYDFMGGDNRYKSSLGEDGPAILTVAVQRDCFKLRLENQLRLIKQRLRGSSPS